MCTTRHTAHCLPQMQLIHSQRLRSALLLLLVLQAAADA
jgi:hypothetical protein